MPESVEQSSMKSIIRVPKEDRSRAPVEAILEAAGQIVEEDGMAGLKVVTLAERCGLGHDRLPLT